MKQIFTAILVAGFTTMAVASVSAAPEPTNPKRQTQWHLYVNSVEANKMEKDNGDKVLFVDVRDPIEIMFTGFTNMVDVNIPFKMVNRSTWHAKKPVYQMVTNKNFESDIAVALKKRGMSKDDAVIIMCRSGGTRGAPAANTLWGKGYKKVFVVTDGFEGGTVKEGDHKGWRLKNGWKNSGLPWSYKLNQDKMYMVK